jgi:hypothetical protein
MEPCGFVSVPVFWVELVPVVAVAVPCVFAWLPAVEPVPSIEPDCGFPLSFEDVFVFLLLLLQPKANAAASARPYAYFMWCLLKGFRGAFLGTPHERRESPAAPER